MRLLNKDTRQFQWFTDESIPPFLILSHRWLGSETTLQKFLERDAASEVQSPGIRKILKFCDEVMSRREEYVWIDTCCIDKTSSVELQEAINSMYRWYELATLCVVYLDDVDGGGVSPVPDEVFTTQLRKSKWFTRGWTLQELLAPKKEVFVDRNWNLLGNRADLAEILESITNIDPLCYGDAAKIRSQPVASRMAWMSLRTTSRVEDLAYCLLGIFDVNMPMLYGEGRKAFRRLQQQIIQDIDDESIFLWNPDEVYPTDTMPILAPSPSYFAVCRHQAIEKDVFFDREPYRMTTKGLEFQLYGERNTQFAPELTIFLNCSYNGRRAMFNIKRVGTHWLRVAVNHLQTVKLGSHPVPLNAWEEFEKSKMQLAFQGAGFGGGAVSSRSGGAAVSDFERERIRFKVYIA